MNRPLSPVTVPVPKQLRYTPGIASGLLRESAAAIDQGRKVNYAPLYDIRVSF